MQRVYGGLSILTLLGAVAFFGACTVHHHHHGDGQAVRGQPTHPGYQSQGAPGQQYEQQYAPAPGTPINPGYGPERTYDNTYNNAPEPNYQPTDPYAAPRANARTNARTNARNHRHCDCARKHEPAFTPRTYAPAGPVTPREMQSSDPADWLE